MLPVRTLSSDAEILETLDSWGIGTLRALAELPVLQLSERLGQRGVLLHELARGARVRALVLAQASLTFEEEMELDDAVEELEPLSFLLGRLLDQVCARLESRALAVQTIRVWFELEPSFEKDVQSLNDESRKKTAPKEFTKVLTLPVAMRDAKVLLKLLRLSLQSDAPKSPIQKDTDDGGRGGASRGAEWIVCAAWARSGKTGVDGGAAGEVGGGVERWSGGIDRHASRGEFSSGAVDLRGDRGGRTAREQSES